MTVNIREEMGDGEGDIGTKTCGQRKSGGRGDADKGNGDKEGGIDKKRRVRRK